MSIDISIKKRAIALRLEGKSYTQIQRELGLASKGTLSAWFRDLELPPKSLKLLEKNIARAAEKGLLEFNVTRTRRIAEENKDADEKGSRLVRSLSKRELMLVGAALYWGEGTKNPGRNRTARLVFTNSDPQMVKLFLRFVREVLDVPEEKIAAELRLYDSIDPEQAKKYWSGITQISTKRFWTTTGISRASLGKRPFNSLPYGTIAVRVRGRTIFHKVMGMVRGLTNSEN